MERANFPTACTCIVGLIIFFLNKYESKKSKTENVICFGGIEISTLKVNFLMPSHC